MPLFVENAREDFLLKEYPSYDERLSEVHSDSNTQNLGSSLLGGFLFVF